MSEIILPNNANSDSAYVVDGNNRNRALMTANLTDTFTPSKHPNGLYGYYTGSDGKKHRALQTAVIFGGNASQAETMPTASAETVGKIIQYIGATTSSYNNGYFYKGTSTTSGSSASASVVEGSTGITATSVTKATFETKITTTGDYYFVYDGTNWTLENTTVSLSDYGITVTNASATAEVDHKPTSLTVTVDASLFSGFATETGGYDFFYHNGAWTYESEEVTLATYGVTVTGTPEEDDLIEINFVKAGPHEGDTLEVVYNAGTTTYSWNRINVQPSGGGSGDVESVNGKTGVVVLDGTDINATVGGATDTITNQLERHETQIAGKANASSITGATKSKITYDAQGIITAGADLEESDIPALSISKVTNLQSELDSKFPQYETMPTASASNLGDIVQFTGTTGTYTNGYVYQCSQVTSNTPASTTVTTSGTAGLGTVLCNTVTFGEQVSPGIDTYNFEFVGYPETIIVRIDPETTETKALTRDEAQDADNMYAWSSNENTYWTDTLIPEVGTDFRTASQAGNLAFSAEEVTVSTSTTGLDGRWQRDYSGEGDLLDATLSDYGISYNGVALVGAKIQVVYTAETTDNDTTYSWVQKNVQPSSGASWGSISGTLSSQTDLQTALDSKASISVNTTATLTSAGWSSSGQTISVTGITATGVVFVSPAASSASVYGESGIICTAQSANSLTFTCTTTPASDVVVNIVQL